MLKLTEIRDSIADTIGPVLGRRQQARTPSVNSGHLPLKQEVKSDHNIGSGRECVMRIGEAAEAAGMTAKTLRFYDDRALLPAAERAANGYRDYGQEILSLLGFIRRARTAGLTLAQIQDTLRLRDSGQTPCIHVRDLLADRLSELDIRIAELTTLRPIVADIHDHVAAADPASYDPGETCSYV